MKVIALLCSDIHLSENAPVARSAEKCWFEAMKRSLGELKYLSDKHNVPVIVAGDIFDKAKSGPAIINFALEYFPDNMFGIPGQHDLINHRLADIEKTSYWTLVKAGKITNIGYDKPIIYKSIKMYGFPWGTEIKPLEGKKDPSVVHLAVIHHYLYTNKTNSYYGVSEENHLRKFRSRLKGFDAAVFGDNHISHLTETPEISIFNAGTLMRRAINEIEYKPTCGLLYNDGTINPHFLDATQDKFINIEEAEEKEQQKVDTAKFIQELKSLGKDSLDFHDAVKKYMNIEKVNEDVQELVWDSMET